MPQPPMPGHAIGVDVGQAGGVNVGLDVGVDLGLDGRTELRVHGVSGTPPEAVLDFPLLRRVAGDEDAAFLRRWFPGGRSADLGRKGRLEAYSWGGLTSGSVARAGWIALLPFMIVNLAHWMLPPVPPAAGRGRRRAGGAAAVLVRLIALSLTLTLVLAAAQIAMDILAWQCAANIRCGGPLGATTAAADSWWAIPGRRVAFASLLPALLGVLLVLLGRAQPRRTAASPDAVVAMVGDSPLERASFWRGNPGLAALRRAHLAAALATVAWVLARVTLSWAEGSDQGLARAIEAGSVGVLLAAVAAVALPWTGRASTMSADALNPSMGRADQHHPWQVVLVRYLGWVSLGCYLSALALTASSGGGVAVEPGSMPGLTALVLGLFGVQLVLLALLLMAIALVQPWLLGTGPTGVSAYGFGAAVAAFVAWLSAGAFAAGLTYRVIDVLGTVVLTSQDAVDSRRRTLATAADASLSLADRLAAAEAPVPLVIPPAYAWAGLLTFVLVLGLLLGAARTTWVVRRRTKGLFAVVTAEYGPASPPEGRWRVARARAWASLGDNTGRIVGRWAMFAGGAVVAIALWFVATGQSTQVLTLPAVSAATDVGTWLVAGIGLGLVFLVPQTVSNKGVRRSVGIAWDVGTFWPRAAHPMAPPSYGERAVPDLAERVVALTSGRRDSVLLSGHSQGSVLVTAALLQLPAETRLKVGLLTHGCPLRRLYARFFPAYFGIETLRCIPTVAGLGWRNLYRATDPIGSWVLAPTGDDPDRCLPDPYELGDDISGHSGYWFDPAYPAARESLR